MGAEQSQGRLEQGLENAGLDPNSQEFAAVKAALQQRPAGPPLNGLMAAAGAVPLPVDAANSSAAGEPFGAAAEKAEVSDAELLSQLVQALSKRVGYSLLLSDLGVLLPKEHRQWVKEKGGLRSMLQRHPNLFRVAGQPGKESVSLLFDGASSAASAPGGAAAADGGHMAPGCVGGPQRAPEPASGLPEAPLEHQGFAEAEQRRREEEEENESAVQLRGLPYRASITDIKTFLGSHAEFLKEECVGQAGPIQLVLNRDGRPSGFAKVQFTSPAAAKAARDSLHNRRMDMASGGSDAQSRYVEIFLFSERPNKLRFKRTAATDAATLNNEEEDAEAAGVTKQQVYEECKAHMESPGKGELLLSMLGVALSQGSRLYLKRTDQGLKHFLSQYPQYFLVDGAKGRECVYYLPVRSDIPIPQAQAADVPGYQSSQAQRLQAVAEESVPQSPTPVAADQLTSNTPRGAVETPSDWGTPYHALSSWDPRCIGRPKLPPAAGDAAGDEGQRDGLPAGLLPDSNLAATFGAAWSNWAPPGAPGAFWGNPYWPPPGGGPPPPQPWGAAPSLNRVPNFEEVPPWHNMPMPAASAASAPAMQVPPKEAAGAPGSPAAVRLRGLPFDATEQDVLNFFSKFNLVEFIEEGQGKVKMLTKPNGKPSGQALVWMQSRAHANLALMDLDGQNMRTPDSAKTRYIEVFLHEEGDNSMPASSSKATTSAAAPVTAAAAAQPLPTAGLIFPSGMPLMPTPTLPPMLRPPGAQAVSQFGAKDDGPIGIGSETSEASWHALFTFLRTKGEVAEGEAGLPGMAGVSRDPAKQQAGGALRVDSM